MDLGRHAAFIWSSYAIFAVVLVGMVVWLITDGRRLKRGLDDMEARGVRRRSER
jgi:heme exporter protein D